VSTDRGPRTLLFQGEMMMSIPGRSQAHLALFNGGEFLRQETFVTGYRSQILDAAIVKDRLPGEELIAVETRGWSGAKRYYALINDRPVLVRLEESEGELLANEYPWSHVFENPDPPLQADDWIRQLDEPRASRVLQALVWLGPRNDESLRNDLVHPVVCRDPRTLAAVQRLAKHENPWVAEMAAMTLQKLSTRYSRQKTGGE